MSTLIYEDATRREEEALFNGRIVAEKERDRVKALLAPIEEERAAIDEARWKLAERFAAGDPSVNDEDRTAQVRLADLTRQVVIAEIAASRAHVVGQARGNTAPDRTVSDDEHVNASRIIAEMAAARTKGPYA